MGGGGRVGAAKRGRQEAPVATLGDWGRDEEGEEEVDVARTEEALDAARERTTRRRTGEKARVGDRPAEDDAMEVKEEVREVVRGERGRGGRGSRGEGCGGGEVTLGRQGCLASWVRGDETGWRCWWFAAAAAAETVKD